MSGRIRVCVYAQAIMKNLSIFCVSGAWCVSAMGELTASDAYL
jgi:hypothetical protein